MRFASFIVILSVGIFLFGTMAVFFKDAALTGTANWRIVARFLPHGDADSVSAGTAVIANAYCNGQGANTSSDADGDAATDSALATSSSSPGSENPLVNFLDTVGASSSFESRARLAIGMGISRYTGSKSQDAAILRSLNAIPDFWSNSDVSQVIPSAALRGNACTFGENLLSSLNP